ncbi:MAG: methylated-DNA--[protein]-cysteine S-methyltransferase [Treponema sp.]|nr:methylated-DNA--[protein]-cysteine S-methyltransferase [Treponema sp.]
MHVDVEPRAFYFGTPVLLLSTLSEDGSTNIAPLSCAWWLNTSCLLGIGSRSKTVQNLRRSGKCVITLPSEDLVETIGHLALSSGVFPLPACKAESSFAYIADKFGHVGLHSTPSSLVRPARVTECPVQLEARGKGAKPIAPRPASAPRRMKTATDDGPGPKAAPAATVDGPARATDNSRSMKESERSAGVRLWLRQEGDAWFGLAERAERLVAAAVGRTREEAARVLSGCLSPGLPSRSGEGSSEFAEATARMLAAIEAGDERGKRLELADECLGEPDAAVFRLAAAIPLGYASSYGRIAAAAGTIAREVGRLMARNPLYPIVPCHRVVGSDYALVGYRGMTSGSDLDDKLARLRAEARGHQDELVLEAARGLVVFPVERVIARAQRGRSGREDGQLSLW